MLINTILLKQLYPCQPRWENYLKYYSEFSGSFDEFVDLENLSYGDKIWVAKKVLNKNQMVHFGLLCAESVLPNFEKVFPADKSVRDCIELLKSFKDFSNLTLNQIESARSAAESARSAAESARSAAWSARSAAESAAESAAWSARSAAESAAWSARSAAWSARSAARSAAESAQHNHNLTLLKMAASL